MPQLSPTEFVRESRRQSPAEFLASRQATEQPAEQPGLAKRFMDAILPDAREAFRIGGAMIGGAIGAGGATIAGIPIAAVPAAVTGGTFLAGAGESIYQLLETALGGEDAPETSQEAASGVYGAMAQGALQEGVTALAGKPATTAIRRSMARTTEDALAPTTLPHKASVRKIAGEFVEVLPVARSRTELLSKVEGGLSRAVSTLEDAYSKIPDNLQLSTSEILSTLRRSRAELFTRGKKVPGSSTQVRAYDDLIWFFRGLPELKVGELRSNRQLWDRLVRYSRTPGAAQPETEAVYKEAADLVRRMVNNNFDEVADANHATHLWSTASEVLKRAEIKATNEPFLSFRDAVAMAIGGTAGATVGAPQIGALAGLGVRRMMSSTPWDTATVAMRRRAIQALNKGGEVGFQEAMGILSGSVGARGVRMLRSEGQQ